MFATEFGQNIPDERCPAQFTRRQPDGFKAFSRGQQSFHGPFAQSSTLPG